MEFINAMFLKDLISLRELELNELEKRMEANQIRLTELKVALDDDARDHPEVELVNKTDNTLVPLVCNCCGGRINKDTLTCDFCGTAFNLVMSNPPDPLGRYRGF